MDAKIKKTKIFTIEEIVKTKKIFDKFLEHSSIYRGYLKNEVRVVPKPFKHYLYELMRKTDETHIHLIKVTNTLNEYMDILLDVEDNEKEQC